MEWAVTLLESASQAARNPLRVSQTDAQGEQLRYCGNNTFKSKRSFTRVISICNAGDIKLMLVQLGDLRSYSAAFGQWRNKKKKMGFPPT
jgi:hypothetical protein